MSKSKRWERRRSEDPVAGDVNDYLPTVGDPGVAIGKIGAYLAIVAVIAFGLGGISLATTGAFLPWREQIRRETFEQSQSFVQGKITTLNRLRQDYAGANSAEHRCALRATALHEAATANTLPTDLETWVSNLRGEPCAPQD